MSAAHQLPLESRVELVAQLLDDIASAAETIDRIAYFTPVGEGKQEEQMLAFDQCRALVQRMGWMADVALDKLYRGQVRGGAEQWLLAPRYMDTIRGQTSAQGGAQ